MNLSKIYSSQESFQPEEIIRARLKEAPVFGSSIISSDFSDRSRREQGFTPEAPPSAVSPAKARKAASSHKDEPAGEQQAAADQQTPDPQQSAEGAGPELAQKKSKQPPAQPPGISQKELERQVSEAYQQGLAEGQLRAEQDFGAAANALHLICQQVDTLRETILKNSIDELKEMVIAIAGKVIRHSVSQQSQTIIETVEEAIHKAVRSEEFYIFVNPEDYEVIAAKAEELIAGINGLNNIVVKKDAGIERGGCRLESDNCTVDASIDSQLAIIGEHLQQQ